MPFRTRPLQSMRSSPSNDPGSSAHHRNACPDRPRLLWPTMLRNYHSSSKPHELTATLSFLYKAWWEENNTYPMHILLRKSASHRVRVCHKAKVKGMELLSLTAVEHTRPPGRPHHGNPETRRTFLTQELLSSQQAQR